MTAQPTPARRVPLRVRRTDSPPGSPWPDRFRLLARGLGQTLITLGVVVLLFCVYELEITGLYTHKEQKKLSAELTHSWAIAPPPARHDPPDPLTPYVNGQGIAIIFFPTLGLHYVVVQGVDTDDLKKGPGHYPGTARFGQIGNVVISGHRTTYLAPFNRVDQLHAGSPIVIETQYYWYTYSVLKETVVSPTTIAVTYPVPYRPGIRPTQRLLTLTTCNPKYSARQRLIVLAVLTSPLPKGPGVVPAALRGST